MGRPPNTDLNIDWKICLPATLAGRVEYLLMDPITGKPKVGSRRRIITALLEGWIAQQGVHDEASIDPLIEFFENRIPSNAAIDMDLAALSREVRSLLGVPLNA